MHADDDIAELLVVSELAADGEALGVLEQRAARAAEASPRR